MSEIERCELEIRELHERADVPAYLIVMAIEDWEYEKRLIALDQAEARA
jgi:hypothetical protein